MVWVTWWTFGNESRHRWRPESEFAVSQTYIRVLSCYGSSRYFLARFCGCYSNGLVTITCMHTTWLPLMEKEKDGCSAQMSANLHPPFVPSHRHKHTKMHAHSHRQPRAQIHIHTSSLISNGLLIQQLRPKSRLVPNKCNVFFVYLCVTFIRALSMKQA